MSSYATRLKGIAAILTMKAEIQFVKPAAFCRPPASTRAACAARLIRQNDMISGLDGLYFPPCLLDDARTFMPQDLWAVGCFPVMNHTDIRMTHSGSNRSYECLRIPRAFHVECFNLERTVLFS
jgi:hypothetical protein